MDLGGMQFGVSIEAPVNWDELLSVARAIDTESRFASLWISDSMMANGPPDDPRLDAWTALAAIAHATSRVRLGVMVSGNAYRHPALLAKIVTTIDHISNGRVELGLGAGWPGENRRYGIDFGGREERVERLEEALQVIKALWTQERPMFRGKHYQLDGPPYSPKNVQWPHPPILVGGGSDAMLRIIAKHADASNPMIDAREAHGKIAAYCAEIGRDPKEIRRTNSYPFFMHDDGAGVERAKAMAREQYGASDEDVARNLFGTPAEVRRQLQDVVAAGIDEVILFQLPRVHLKSLLRFSDEVITASA